MQSKCESAKRNVKIFVSVTRCYCDHRLKKAEEKGNILRCDMLFSQKNASAYRNFLKCIMIYEYFVLFNSPIEFCEMCSRMELSVKGMCKIDKIIFSQNPSYLVR